MAFNTKKIAIDLGNTSTRVIVRKRGIIVNEPTVIARDSTYGDLIAVGNEALTMAGRSPEPLDIIHPLQSGVIADFSATKDMLSSVLQSSMKRIQLRKVEAMITVSASASSTEKRALVDVLNSLGIEYVHLIQAPIAAALGAGLPINEPRGSVVVDIGSGTTEVGVFSLGGVVAMDAIRVGGDAINDEIIRYMRRNHNLALSRSEIRKIVQEFVHITSRQDSMLTVHGQNTIHGTPKSSRIRHSMVVSHIESPLNKILQVVRKALEKMPPDLLGDVITHGIVLTGGSSQIHGLDEFLTRKLNVACVVGQDPMLCSAKGSFMALTHAQDYTRAMQQ